MKKENNMEIDDNNKLDKIIELLEQILFKQGSIENYLCEIVTDMHQK